MRLLLISMPDSLYLFKWAQARLPNLAISSLAGNLDRRAWEVKLLDLVLRPHGVRHTVKRVIEEYRPHVVGLSAMSFQFHTACRIAGLVRRLDPSIRIVLGGYHATMAYDEIEKDGKACLFDYLVRGEGEATMRELSETIEQGGPGVENVNGLSFRRGEGFVHNPSRPLLDPTAIALPDRESRILGHRDGLNGWMDSVETSRGCLMTCSFCSIRQMYGQTFRRFPIPRVIEDIRRARARGARRIFFSDDNITIDVDRFKTLCQAIVEEGLNDIRFSTQASTIGIASSEDLVRMMRDANFTIVFLGIEGLDEQKLLFMGKGKILDRSLRAITLLHNHGIQVAGGFIAGLPDDRPADIRNVFRFVRDNKIAIPIVWCSTPYPRTKFREDLLRERLVVNRHDYYDYNGWCTNVRTRHMSRLRLSVERSAGYVGFIWRSAVLGDNHYVGKIRKEGYLTMVYFRMAAIRPFLRAITGTWQTTHGTRFYYWWEWPLALRDAPIGPYQRWKKRREALRGALGGHGELPAMPRTEVTSSSSPSRVI